MLVSVSILGIFENKKKKIKELNRTKADYLHLDIMDGNFVNAKTDDFDRIREAIEYTKLPLDIHIMVNDIIDHVNIYRILNPQFITFHFEATDNPLTMIDYIKNNNIKVGMSINPNTPVTDIYDYLEHLDLILVMAVEPGAGGQKFNDIVTNKIKTLKHIREEKGYHYVIEVDGGINDQTATLCNDADILAIGNYITSSNNYAKQIDTIKKIFNSKD